MNRARGELERRRQEAYRARATATVKIQRWYRQRRAIRARTLTNGDASVRNLPAEESCTGSTSTSATLTTISQQEIQGDFFFFFFSSHCVAFNMIQFYFLHTGISRVVSNDKVSVSDGDDNLVQNRNAWSSSSQLEERSNSFDEFVNSEVAVARAMVDDRYIENLNDAQKKRVERLKAYRKFSDNQVAASETLQNEPSNISIGTSLLSDSSNMSQVIAEEIPGHKPNGATEEATRSTGKIKSSIPVRSTKKPLSNLHKRGIKPEAAKKADKPQMTTRVEPVMQDVNAQIPNRSKQKHSKPMSNQEKQQTMKEQYVAQKQQQIKEHRQLDQTNDDTCTESVEAIEDLVKIGGKGEMAGVNDTNMQKAEGDITSEHIDISSSSSSEGGAQVSKGTQTGAHTREGHTIKSRSKGQQAGQKVLKFSSNVMWQNSNSTVHDPFTEPSETKLHGIVKQPPYLLTAEMDQSQQEEELSPLKKSSATTRLTLECEIEDEIQSDSAPLLKRRHKNTGEIHSESVSLLNLGQRSSHRSKHSTEARRQRIINAALANTDDSDSDDSSPEHLAYYTGGQPRATRVSYGGTKFASQGGGYGAAYAKRRETNRKRIIKVSQVLSRVLCPGPFLPLILCLQVLLKSMNELGHNLLLCESKCSL